MADTITLDSLRQHPKALDEYTEEEKAVILENQDKWNDEEKWAFNPLTTPEDIAPTETPQPVETPVVTEAPAPVATVDTPVFKSKEELDAYVNKLVSDKIPAKSEDSKETPPPFKPFDENWIPQNANDFAAALYEKLAPKMVETINEQTTEERQRYVDYNNELDKQYNQLAQEHKLPALDSDEGADINKQIAAIAVAHGKDNYIDAYNLWSIIPKEKGGGYDFAAPTAIAEVKPSMASQRQQAAKISSSTGERPSTVGNSGSYKDIHGQDLDTLLERALK